MTLVFKGLLLTTDKAARYKERWDSLI